MPMASSALHSPWLRGFRLTAQLDKLPTLPFELPIQHLFFSMHLGELFREPFTFQPQLQLLVLRSFKLVAD